MSESLSYSRAYTFAKCKMMYKYKYIDKLKPVPRTQHFDSWKRMQRGIMTHAALEALFLGEDVSAKVAAYTARLLTGGLTDEQSAALTGMETDALTVATAAAAWLPASDFEPLTSRDGAPMVEAELTAPLPGWKGFVGYADLVARHKPTGRVLVLDYKVRERFEAPDSDRFNKQFALYQHVLRTQLNIECHGSLLFEMKPTPPAKQHNTPAGTLLSIDDETVAPNGQFRVIPTYRSPQFLANVWSNFEREALDIARFEAQHAWTNMSGFNCKSCDFVAICTAELDGADVEYVKKANYTYPGYAPMQINW